MIDHFLPGSIYTLELGRELKKKCELSIFCRRNAGVFEEGITWMPYFYPGGKGKTVAAYEYGASLAKLAETIRKGRFDVVHIQSFRNIRYEVPFYFGLRKYYKKLVLTVHNVLPHEEKTGDKGRYKKIYQLCDELIVHNETSAKMLKDMFGISERKISVIAHGTYQTHMEFKKNSKKDDRKHFLQFGYIRRYKGIDILLEAIAQIPEADRHKLSFTIAGRQYKKDDGTDYEKMIRSLGIEDYINFRAGHVPDKELPDLFGEADFLIFPYRHIYGSGALMFAYTYEKPVIVSEIPAFMEETDGWKTGLHFESENPRELAKAIMRAAECNEEQIKQYQAEIRRLVTDKYNWKISAAKTAEVYRKK